MKFIQRFQNSKPEYASARLADKNISSDGKYWELLEEQEIAVNIHVANTYLGSLTIHVKQFYMVIFTLHSMVKTNKPGMMVGFQRTD